jgi:signal transduction histidine kinase
MLHDLLLNHRDEIIERVQQRLASELPPPPEQAMVQELPTYVDEVIGALKRAAGEADPSAPPHQSAAAAEHGRRRERQGVGITEVVHDFAVVCDAMTVIAAEQGVTICPREWQVMNEAIDAGISQAISEYWEQNRQRTNKETAEHLGFVVHELRNALGSSLTALRVLQLGRVGLQSRTGEVLERGLLRAADLVTQVSAEVVLLSGRDLAATRVRLPVVLQQAATAAQLNERRVRVSVVADRDLQIDADEKLLVSAVTNVVQNAVKFSRDGGSVEVRAVAEQNGVVVEVEDECGGLGRDPDELFRPFVQGGPNRSGLGLGLAIVVKVMQAHGGTVRVQDLPGKGCIFRLAFPQPAPHGRHDMNG